MCTMYSSIWETPKCFQLTIFILLFSVEQFQSLFVQQNQQNNEQLRPGMMTSDSANKFASPTLRNLNVPINTGGINCELFLAFEEVLLTTQLTRNRLINFRLQILTSSAYRIIKVKHHTDNLSQII